MKKIISLFWILVAMVSVSMAQHAYPEGLRMGEKAPEFATTDVNGRTVDSKDILKKGPLILIFYKAEVCPYGKQEIFDLQDKIVQMARAGKNVVAIGPEQSVAKAAFTKAGITTEVPFIEDKNYNIFDRYKVTYRLDALTKEFYARKGMVVKQADGDGSYPLSMPTVYIISPEGRVKYANCNSDNKVEQSMTLVERILNE